MARTSLLLVLVALISIAGLSSAQFFEAIWPTDQELLGLPQIISPGYIQNCLAAGTTGGCSACVHGTDNACNWVTIDPVGLAPNQGSMSYFGGIRGVCVPKGVENYPRFASSYYYRYFTTMFGTTSGYNPPNSTTQALIRVQNQRCPADPNMEPILRGYGISPAQEQILSTNFHPEYCDFPKADWPVDRTATIGTVGGGVGLTYGSYYFTPGNTLCNLFNNADNDLSKTFGFNWAPGPGSYATSRFNLKDWLDGKIVPLFYGPPTPSSKLKEVEACQILDQAAGCTGSCPEYGKTYGLLMCPEALKTLYTSCLRWTENVYLQLLKKRALAQVINPEEDSIVGLGTLILLIGSGQNLNTFNFTEYKMQYDVTLADWRSRGFEPKCFDPFRVKPSSRWKAESDLSAPCSQLGRPYVDTCDGSCEIIYYDNRNCGKCGHVCPNGLNCFKGACTSTPAP